MEIQERVKVTRSIWTAAMVGIILSSIITAPFLHVWMLGLVFMVLCATIVVTGFVWQWGVPVQLMQNSEEAEKVKRDHIEAVLRRLSDSQLETLRDRIATGQLSDSELTAVLEEEAAYKRKR